MNYYRRRDCIDRCGFKLLKVKSEFQESALKYNWLCQETDAYILRLKNVFLRHLFKYLFMCAE